jgi:hypothetical protein
MNRQRNKYGGLTAAPVFREVGAWTMNRFQINPDMRLVHKEDKQEKQPKKGCRPRGRNPGRAGSSS